MGPRAPARRLDPLEANQNSLFIHAAQSYHLTFSEANWTRRLNGLARWSSAGFPDILRGMFSP
jgi:hypothetical protein